MKTELYAGYAEPEWKVQDRMNRKRLAAVVYDYGEDWEQDAEAVRDLLDMGENVEPHPVELAYELDKVNDPRTEDERAWDEYCEEVYETQESVRPGLW